MSIICKKHSHFNFTARTNIQKIVLRLSIIKSIFGIAMAQPGYIEDDQWDWSGPVDITDFDVEKVVQDISSPENPKHLSNNISVNSVLLFDQFESKEVRGNVYFTNEDTQVSEHSDIESTNLAPQSFVCDFCFLEFSVKEILYAHSFLSHGICNGFENSPPPNYTFDSYSVTRVLTKNGSGFFQQYKYDMDMREILDSFQFEFLQEIHVGIKIFSHIKVKIFMNCSLNAVNSQFQNSTTLLLESGVAKIMDESRTDNAIQELYRDLDECKRNNFRNEDNAYELEVNFVRILILKQQQPMSTAIYLPLPYVLQKRRNLFVNVNNSTEAYWAEKLTKRQEGLRNILDLQSSFLFAVAAGIKSAKYNADSMKTYRDVIKSLNLTDITMPMTLNQIPRFESQNPQLEICIFKFKDIGIGERTRPDLFPQNHPEDNTCQKRKKSMARGAARDQIIYEYSSPLYISLNQNRQYSRDKNSISEKRYKIDLFLIVSEQKTLNSGSGSFKYEHYVLCKDIGSLFRYSNRCRSYICKYCLKRFQTSFNLTNHIATRHKT
ncbi:unnamed protein product [Allacma fusca]|uniref:C2H2-type domain-containing protein n=1 Tax=Allacma fusca TaxID=39272 RepID=A0A8J2KWL9_9HEXA|nr:unnamed protein product [Allacma fusca]